MEVEKFVGRQRLITRIRALNYTMRRWVTWLQLFGRMFAHRYHQLMKWEVAGRPVFLCLLLFLIQKNLRRYLAWKKSCLQLQASAITLQTTSRAMASRNEFKFRKQTKAVICIQSRWRCHSVCRQYERLKKAAVICQCAWRQRLARRELRKLRMAYLEKARVQEIAMLHEVVHELQLQVEEARIRVIAEREAARKAVEEAPPVIKEIYVLVDDTEKISSLNAEVGRLKALLGAERNETFSARKAHAKAEERNEGLAKKVGDAERKINQLQDALQRMEEKASNIEAENKLFRQQAVAISPTINSLAGYPKLPIFQSTPENENIPKAEMKPSLLNGDNDFNDVNSGLSNTGDLEADKQQQKNQDLLIKCISQDLGFSTGRPIAAYLIYRCLLHWRSFEAERTSVFDRIIKAMGTFVEACKNNDVLAYWLSNSCTLLLLLQQTLKTNRKDVSTRRRWISSSLSGRMPLEIRASQNAERPFRGGRLIGLLSEVRQVEAKYPAHAFKQQLTAFLEKVYGMMRHNLKKELSPLLCQCIQAPRTFSARAIKGSSPQANDLAQQASMAHWRDVVKILTNYLNILKSNYVPSFLIRKLFTQIFSFINVQLFNSLLLRRECCSLTNSEYVKAGLAELEHWCFWLTEEYAGAAWDELKHIRQAVGFLVNPQKPSKTLTEITNDLCPALTIRQLYRVISMYFDDKYGTHGVSSDVISSMRSSIVQGSDNAPSSPSLQDGINSFLLDDDFSIPFSVDDIVKLMTDIEVADVDLSPLIQENSGFAF